MILQSQPPLPLPADQGQAAPVTPPSQLLQESQHDLQTFKNSHTGDQSCWSAQDQGSSEGSWGAGLPVLKAGTAQARCKVVTVDRNAFRNLHTDDSAGVNKTYEVLRQTRLGLRVATLLGTEPARLDRTLTQCLLSAPRTAGR